MGTSPPIWLLDIDGVVNAVTAKPDRNAWPLKQWIRTSALSAEGTEWPILAATPVIDFLRRVHDEGLAEIWWHSTWQHDSVNVGAALGLPEWPVRECPEFSEQETFIATPLAEKATVWWKLPTAQRVIDEGRRLLWTDDDASFQLHKVDTSAWAPHSLVIAPAVATGLTPKHLRRIDRWLTDAVMPRVG